MKELEDVILFHEHDGTPGQQHVSIHRYPYTDFPKIKSHVQPQFLLLLLGHLLQKKSDSELLRLQRDFSPRTRPIPFPEIAMLYTFWVKAPKNWKNDESFCDSGKPFPEEKDDPKDQTYKPSGSVASSMRTQQKRECRVYSTDDGVVGSERPSPSGSLFSGNTPGLNNQPEVRPNKRPRTEENGSQNDDQ